MRLRLLLLAALVLTGCPGSIDVASSAISVTVAIADDSPTRCVRVVAKSGDTARTTEAIVRGGKNELKIAIVPTGPEEGDLEIYAQGFIPGGAFNAAAGCAEPLTLHEQSDSKSARFDANTIANVHLELNGHVTGDEDNDGYRAASSGGNDCDDNDPLVNPSRTEICNNGKDDNCASGADCAEGACAGALCDDSDVCTRGETCIAIAACGGGQPVTCDQPPSQCHQATGTCGASGCSYGVTTAAPCDGGYCRSDGVCVPATVEVLCGDGVDNNGVNGTDCADPDCNTQQCAAATGCLNARACAGGSCAAATTSCTTPGPCQNGPGSCATDGGCAYTLKAPGASCGGANECSVSGVCGPAETGTQCADGQDNDGDNKIDCADPSCNGSVCNDNNACFANETCSGTSCTGTTVTCNNPPGQCFATTTCNTTNGCVYPVTVNAPCDGGYCKPDGGCEPPPINFPYAPSNFEPIIFSKPDAAVDIDCAATFASDDTPQLTWCGTNPRPQVVSVNSTDGGVSYRFLVMSSLNIRSSGSLRLVGEHPVILVVDGNATVAGNINVSSPRGGSLGSGGSSASNPAFWCQNGGAGGNAATGTLTGGGGGGAFGSAGAQGGNGYNSSNNAGAAGTVVGNVELKPLFGGCNGGRGGATMGGNGGGAVQISVVGSLTVSGTIAAPGGGGFGADPQAQGGGGAGAGGAILLEAEDLNLTNGTLTAQGGAGGEGCAGAAGTDGQDGRATFAVAIGGDGTSMAGGGGGDGGVRGVNPTRGTNGNSANNGGGGGGGGAGVGRIRLNSFNSCTITGATFSPDYSRRNGSGNCP